MNLGLRHIKEEDLDGLIKDMAVVYSKEDVDSVREQIAEDYFWKVVLRGAGIYALEEE